MSTSDISGIEQLVRDHARDRADRCADAFVELAKSLAPRRTGALAESIERGEVIESGSSVTVEFTVGAEYARYQEEGTGIYGPDGRELFADELTDGWTTSRGTRVHRFVFDWPAAGGIVFARRVKGTEATHFWTRAVEQWPSVARNA